MQQFDHTHRGVWELQLQLANSGINGRFQQQTRPQVDLP